MITPINNIQPSINFQGVRLKTPKKFSPSNKPTFIKKTSDKFSKILKKTQAELDKMDNETKDLLLKTIALGAVVASAIGFIAYTIFTFVEKIQDIFQ